MRTDLEYQLPRFAEALEREAPSVSVDEIVGGGIVDVDVDRLERPSWSQVSRGNGVSWISATPGDGECEAPIELAPTPIEPSTRRRVALKVALAVAAAAVLVVTLGAIVRVDDGPDPADVPPSTVPIPPPTVPVGPFVGVWLSTDTDGSSQTMQIVRSGADDYEVVIHDEAATTACAGGASTLTGAGRLATDVSLVIAQPELTCDDGTIPPIGPAPQAVLANFTLDLDTATGDLVDNFGIVWQRQGANVDLVESATSPPTSGGMWPQSTLEEVRAAQELADAGDPAYTWQIGTQLTEDDPWAHVDELEIVDRFLREVLGWQAYMFNGWEGGDFNASIGGTDGWVDGSLTDQRFLRCAPGRTNPLYPPQPESEQFGDSCAPTIDDRRYESVSLDLAQLDRRGSSGIWVVNDWRLTAPFAQADPVVVEAEATKLLEEFAAARIDGSGADIRLDVYLSTLDEMPLLYATTTGAPYERSEIEHVSGPRWPHGEMDVIVRMFAEGGATVVEQPIYVWNDGGRLTLQHYAQETTENGRPVAVPYSLFGGEVIASAPDPWYATDAHGMGPDGPWWIARDVWWESDELYGLVVVEFSNRDRVPIGPDCAPGSAPADAAALAQTIRSDANYETTAPVAALIGGVEAQSIDVVLAPGGRLCELTYRSAWSQVQEPETRLRLYLLDLPEGSTIRTLAITVVASEARFEEVIEAVTPIIESIEFHPG